MLACSQVNARPAPTPCVVIMHEQIPLQHLCGAQKAWLNMSAVLQPALSDAAASSFHARAAYSCRSRLPRRRILCCCTAQRPPAWMLGPACLAAVLLNVSASGPDLAGIGCIAAGDYMHAVQVGLRGACGAGARRLGSARQQRHLKQHTSAALWWCAAHLSAPPRPARHKAVHAAPEAGRQPAPVLSPRHHSVATTSQLLHRRRFGAEPVSTVQR